MTPRRLLLRSRRGAWAGPDSSVKGVLPVKFRPLLGANPTYETRPGWGKAAPGFPPPLPPRRAEDPRAPLQHLGGERRVIADNPRRQTPAGKAPAEADRPLDQSLASALPISAVSAPIPGPAASYDQSDLSKARQYPPWMKATIPRSAPLGHGRCRFPRVRQYRRGTLRRLRPSGGEFRRARDLGTVRIGVVPICENKQYLNTRRRQSPCFQESAYAIGGGLALFTAKTCTLAAF